MRSDYVFPPKVLVSYYIFIKTHCKNSSVKIWALQRMGSIKVALPRFPESECTFTLTSLLSFIIFEILFHLVATTKNLFLCV